MITNADSHREMMEGLDAGDGNFLRTVERFGEITDVPRPSGKETLIRNHVTEWAQKNEFEFKTDKVGNVAVYLSSSGDEYANSPATILQAHMDMVTIGNDEVATEAVMVDKGDGHWIESKDRQTTLGADNGIGLAMAMALAEDKSLKHGPLILLFTVDEETGLTGAREFDSNLLPLNSKYLFNLDSEDGAKYIFNGCAGGERVSATIDIADEEKIPDGYQLMEINLGGLLGGHSGVDIHKNRGNSISILTAMLSSLVDDGVDLKLVEMAGGTRDNVIPSSASCKIAVPFESTDIVNKFFADQSNYDGLSELGIGGISAENVKGLKVEARILPTGEAKAVSDITRDRVFGTVGEISELPLGKVGESVVLSTSLSIISTDSDSGTGKKNFSITTLPRAARPEDLDERVNKLKSIFVEAGADTKTANRYNGWLEEADSQAVRIAREAVQEVFSEDAVVAPVHAGLESAYVVDAAKKIGIDMSAVSVGPLMKDVHSVNETVNLKSIAETVKVVKAMIEKIAA